MAECTVEFEGKQVDPDDLKNKGSEKLTPTLNNIIKQSKPIRFDKDQGYTMAGKALLRISDTMQGVISKFRTNYVHRNLSFPEKLAADIWGAEKVGDTWKFNRLPEDRKVETDEGFVDFQTFIKSKQERFDRSALLGEIHHKFLQSKFSTLDTDKAQAAAEYAELTRNSLVTPFHYKWIETTYVDIAKKLDLNIYDAVSNHSKVIAEIPIGNEILGWGGRPDLIIEDPDGYLRLVDFKTNKGIDRQYSYDILRYGRQKYDNITDNQRDLARLQLALYAVIIKANNPDVRFRGLQIAWIPDQRIARSKDHRAKVPVELYIPMIRDYIKNEMPEVWEALPNKERLFDPTEYDTSYAPKVAEELRSNGLKPSEEYYNLLNKISFLMQGSGNDKTFKWSEKKTVAERRRLLKEYLEKLIDLQKGMDKIDAASWEDDLSYLSKYIGTSKDIENAWVRVYQRVYEEKRLLAEQAYQKDMAEFYSYLDPVWKGYLKRKGMPETSILNRTKYNDLYDFLYKDTERGKELRYTEEDFKDFENNHRKVTNEEKAFARYLQRKYEKVFSEGSYLTEKTIEIENNFGKLQVLSPLELHNAPGPNKAAAKFAYYKGWFPKSPITMEEAGNYSLMSKEYWKEFYRRELTHYYETVFEQWNAPENMIPIKYLGNPILDASQRYTLNAEMQFDRFMKALHYKEHMDSVYGLGQAINTYLEMAQEKDNGAGWQNTIDWIKNSLDQHILGLRQQEFKGGLTRQQLATRGRHQQLSPVKLLRAIKKFGSAPIMWLKVASGTRNGIFTYWVTSKEAIKYDIGTKIIGDADIRDFGMKEFVAAQPEWFKMQADAMKNQIHRNKAFLLMQRLRYLPDSFEWGSDPNHLVSTRNKAWSQSTLYMNYSAPEQFLASSIMVAQLKGMKIDFKGKQTSLWDMYEVVEKKQPDGRTIYELEWKKDPDTGKPFVRGIENLSNDPNIPDYREVTELTAKESSKLKYVYQRIHGGYRHEERTYLEYYVLGELFIQFKKYLPNLLKTALMSKGARTLGYYKSIGKDASGQEIMEWHERVMEGRWAVITKMLMAYIGIRTKVDNPTTTFQKWTQKNFSNLENYKWSELSSEDKLGVIDAIVTLSMWIGMYLGYLALFADADDDDQYKKYTERIMNDFTQQYNVMEIGRLLADARPPSVKVAQRFGGSVVDMFIAGMHYSYGNTDEALTQTGRLRGWTEFQNTVPFLSAYRDLVRIVRNERDPDDVITTLYRYAGE